MVDVQRDGDKRIFTVHLVGDHRSSESLAKAFVGVLEGVISSSIPTHLSTETPVRKSLASQEITN